MRSKSSMDRNSDAEKHLSEHLQQIKLVEILVLLQFVRTPKHLPIAATQSPRTTPALAAE